MRLHPRAVRLLPLLVPVLLLPLRGEASGESLVAPGCTPVSPTQVSFFVNPGSEINEIAAVGTTLLLGAKDGTATGYRLWRSEGGAAPTRLDPAPATPWPADVDRVRNFTVLGQRLIFVVKREVLADLWATNETRTAIYPLRTDFQSSLVDGPEFTVVGSKLFFRADHDGNGPTLWMSDETGASQVRVNNTPVSDPSDLTAFNGRLFFAAYDDVAGKELWSVGEAGTDAARYADLWPGTTGSSPASLTVMGSKLYFTATTPIAQDATLWATDGRGVPQSVVGPNKLGTSHGPLQELTAVGDKLFFHMDQPGVTGDELWVSDGTETHTGIVRQIQPGDSGGSPEKLLAVGRMLFFIANDGVSGREPWRSDGTTAGTFMLRQFVDGTVDSLEETVLSDGPGVLLLSIFEDSSGKELWSVSETEIARLTDLSPGVGSSTPHGMTILGNRLYFAANGSAQGQELFSLPLDQVDCNSPSVECPGPLRVEAASSMGALVFLPPPRLMSDDSFTPLTVTYSPAPLGIFPLGTSTSTTITVTDQVGRTASCSPTIIVEDKTGPELVCPKVLVEEATSAAGANVFFPLVARDAVSGVSSVISTRSSGELFRLNEETEVSVTATDGAGNSTPCRFSVAVKDTRPPTFTCPPDIVRVASKEDPPPYNLSYPRPQPVDAVSATLVEDPQHPPAGSPFDLGKTEVVLKAVDSSGNTSQCSFSVHIVDPVAPTITCPGPQQAVATGPEGAVVEFPEAEAEDGFGPPTVRYSAEPGSTFPLGETTVVATASDRGGNQTSCSFTVTVTEQDIPHSGCACRASSASATVYWLLLALVPLWARRRIGRLTR